MSSHGGVLTAELTLEPVMNVARSALRALPLALRRRVEDRGRRSRLRRYAMAMGWAYDEKARRISGTVHGWPVSSYDDHSNRCVLEVLTPSRLPAVVVRPRSGNGGVAVEQDGLQEVVTGDLLFDAAYEVRVAEAWWVRILLIADVRRSLLSAPRQSWSSNGFTLLSVSAVASEPLDLLARVSALSAMLGMVPWEAYPDPDTLPTLSAVQSVMRARKVPLFLLMPVGTQTD